MKSPGSVQPLSLIHIFFRLLAVRDEWFSDDLRKLDDDNVYRKLQGHWIIEMSEMMATANAKSIEAVSYTHLVH